MNLKMTVKAAVTAAVLGAVPAITMAAATPPSSSTGSSLIIQVWDPATHVGLVEYLPNTLQSFSPGGTDGATSNGGLTLTTQLDGSVTAFENLFNSGTNSNLGGTTPTSLDWNVIAVNSNAPNNLLTTGPTNGTLTNRTNGSIGTSAATFNSNFGALFNGINCTTNPCIATGSGSDQATLFLTNVGALNFNASVGAVNNDGSATPSAALGFWQYTQTGGSSLQNANHVAYQNSSGYGQWTLNGQGSLVYSIAGQSVPLPAAAWLFGSGLLGLLGIGRRRQANA